MPPETTEANQADRGGVRSHEYEHGQEMKLNPHLRQHPNPIPDTHYSQVQPQEDNGQDHHDQRSFHHPRPPPHPFVDVERSSEHYQHLHHQHLRYQELRQQPQQDGHGHKYDDKTDAELQEDEDFINKLAEATTQQELIDGRFVMNKDTAVVEPVGLDDNHPYPPPSRVCTDSDGDAGSVTAAEEAGDDSTSNNLSAMDATARDDAATLLHAVSASNVSLSNDEQPTGTAGSAATTAIAIAATSSTSVDRQIMETGVHSDHPRYVVGQHDSIEFPIGENAAASSTSVATSAAYFESEKTLSVSSALSHVATPSSNSTLGSGSREPVVGAASSNKAEGEVGDQSHQGEHYKTGRWTIEESIIFLHLLRRFGRGKWKKFQPYLPFRSIVQIKSHAQKVLKRQAKGDDIYLHLKEVNLTLEQLMEQVRRGNTSLPGGKGCALRLISKKTKTKSTNAPKNGRRAKRAGTCDVELPSQNPQMMDRHIHAPHPPHHIAFHHHQQRQHLIHYHPSPNLYSFSNQSIFPSQYPGRTETAEGNTQYHSQFRPPYFHHYQPYQQHHPPGISGGMVSQVLDPKEDHSSENDCHAEV